MKFEVLSNELLSHLKTISRVLASKTTMPLLDNYMFVVEGGMKEMGYVEEKYQHESQILRFYDGCNRLHIENEVEEKAQEPSLEEKIKEICKQLYKEEYKRRNGNMPAAPEEWHIDKRVLNGRKAETRLCDCNLTDEEIMELMEECHQRFLHSPLCMSSKLKMFVCTFTKALYRAIKDRYETVDGKLAHMHRLVSSKIGNMAGCGLRILQKSFAWLKEEIATFSDNDYWLQRAIDKLSRWKDLEQRICDFLSQSELIIAINNPH